MQLNQKMKKTCYCSMDPHTGKVTRHCEDCLDEQFHKKSHTQQIVIWMIGLLAIIGYIIYRVYGL